MRRPAAAKGIPAVCLLALAVAAFGAGSPGERLVYPAPPQPARLAYGGQIADLQEFSPRRSLLERVGGWLAGSKPAVGLVRPHGLDAGAGLLLIADPETGVVHRLDLDAGDRTRLPAEGRLVQPVDAAVDPATGQAQFLVRIEIEAAELARLGDSRLVPGMPVDVFLAQ